MANEVLARSPLCPSGSTPQWVPRLGFTDQERLPYNNPMSRKTLSDKMKLPQVGSNPASTTLLVEFRVSGAHIPTDSGGGALA